MSRPLVGAYLCPRGAFLVECRVARTGLEVLRSFADRGELTTPDSAVSRLTRQLADAGIRRADVAVALRGFGSAHHVLALPRAREEILAPVVDRELRRLEPQLGEAAVAWLALPDQPSAEEAQPQRQFLAAAVPVDVAGALESGLAAAGHRLLHLTVLAAAMQRLQDEFDAPTDVTAQVCPLPDGAYLGFYLSGSLRLAIEPPLAPGDEQPDPAAIAEELELGAMFVRQQFRGAEIARIAIASGEDWFADAAPAFSERLALSPGRLAVGELDSPELAALGSVLDARAETPLALGGVTRERKRLRATATLRTVSNAMVAAAVLVAAFTLTQAVRARGAATALVDARRHVEQESFGLAPVRETAARRKLIRDARAALRFVEEDRRELQQALAAVGTAVAGSVELDSLRLDRATNGWLALVGGRIEASSNGRAVQALNDFYRELPRRMDVEELALQQLAYADSSDGGALARFQLSFVVPTVGKR